MNHRSTHPEDVPDCFGCKALGIGFQGLQSREGKDPVQVIPVRSDENGRTVGAHHDHWDGRRDATVNAPAVMVRATVEEVH